MKVWKARRVTKSSPKCIILAWSYIACYLAMSNELLNFIKVWYSLDNYNSNNSSVFCLRVIRRMHIPCALLCCKWWCLYFWSSTCSSQKQLKEAAGIIGAGSALFASYLTAVGDEHFYANHLMPLLQKVVGAETAHVLAVRLLSWGLAPLNRYQDPASLVSMWTDDWAPVKLHMLVAMHWFVVI